MTCGIPFQSDILDMFIIELFLRLCRQWDLSSMFWLHYILYVKVYFNELL